MKRIFLISCQIIFSFVVHGQNEQPLNFAGDLVPIQYSFVSTKFSKSINQLSKDPVRLKILKSKCEFYLPYIEAMLLENQVPDDFKYLPIVESELSSSALSRVGASGLWQLMPGTAQGLGLMVKLSADERLSVVKSTKAACNHIKYLYSQLHNWTLVAAAYNVGLGRIQASMMQQKIRNYYFLKLNQETSEYIYKILALKTILNDTSQMTGGMPEPVKKVLGFNSGNLGNKSINSVDSLGLKLIDTLINR